MLGSVRQDRNGDKVGKWVAKKIEDRDRLENVDEHIVKGDTGEH